MALLINRGIVERMRLTEGNGGEGLLTIVIKGQKTVYSGRVFMDGKVERAKLRLLNLGDEVSFRFSRDFSVHIHDFKNHTLEEQGLDFSEV